MTPSRKSAVCVSSAWVCASSSSCSSNVLVSAASSSRFVSQTARVGICAKSCATSWARSESSSAGTTSETRPHARASSGSTRRPVVNHSNARAAPSSLRANHVPPESGTSPIEMKAGTKLAAADAMRTSQARASDRPAPAAGPLTAAITGFSSARIASTLR